MLFKGLESYLNKLNNFLLIFISFSLLSSFSVAAEPLAPAKIPTELFLNQYNLKKDIHPIVTGISPTTLPNGTAGAAYNQILTATGFAPCATSCAWTITSGALPTGLNLSSAGGATATISGTGTAVGVFNFVVTVTEQGGSIYNQGFTILMQNPTLTINPPTLSSMIVGQSSTQTLSTTGGNAPYTYTLVSGSLPPGVNLSSGGAISGIPTSTGTYNFTVRSTDSTTPAGSGTTTKAYSITTTAPILLLSPTTLSNGTVGTAVSIPFATTGGTAPYTYSITSGTLPAGVTLSSSGVLSGTPTAGGTFNFTITSQDSTGGGGPYSISQPYTWVINSPTISLNPTTLPAGTVGTSYSPQTITASGGTSPYTYAVTSGSLPAGLNLSVSGILSGTPTAGGTFNFTITATDSSTGTGPYTGGQAYTLVINTPTITLSPTTLPAGTVGVSYSPQTITASGGTSPYTYAVTSGTLPAGLSLSSAGILSGTPTEGGTFNITITATDSSTGTGAPYTGNQSYTLTINSPVITISPTSLPSSTEGVPYSQNITATGGTTPYSFTVSSGSLPSGLSLTSTGLLSGTPTSSGTFNFTITATDSSTGTGAPYSGSQAYTFTVISSLAPQSPPIAATALSGQTITINATAQATNAPFTGITIVGAPANGVAVVEGLNIIYTSTSTFVGTVVIEYTISNSAGPSDIIRAIVTVINRPDPSKDPEVLGLVAAQTESARRFATTQMFNFTRRMETLHGEGWGRSELGFNLGSLGTSRNTPGFLMEQRRFNSTYINNEQALAASIPALSLHSEDFKNPFAVWVGGALNFGHQRYPNETTNNTDQFHFNTDGISIGTDYRVNNYLSVGVGGGYSHDTSTIGNNGTRSVGESKMGMIYSSIRPNVATYIDSVLGFGSLKFNTDRWTELNNLVSGQRRGNQVFGSTVLGYEYHKKDWLLAPYGRLDLGTGRLDRYYETPLDILSLSYMKQNFSTTAGTLGLRSENSFASPFGLVVPRLRLEYQHYFSASGSAQLTYTDLLDAGTSFLIANNFLNNNNFIGGIGTQLILSNGLRLMFEYDSTIKNTHGVNHLVQLEVSIPM